MDERTRSLHEAVVRWRMAWQQVEGLTEQMWLPPIEEAPLVEWITAYFEAKEELAQAEEAMKRAAALV